MGDRYSSATARRMVMPMSMSSGLPIHGCEPLVTVVIMDVVVVVLFALLLLVLSVCGGE
jgi:hypothetical protein